MAALGTTQGAVAAVLSHVLGLARHVGLARTVVRSRRAVEKNSYAT
jgi:hypothetical protein